MFDYFLFKLTSLLFTFESCTGSNTIKITHVKCQKKGSKPFNKDQPQSPTTLSTHWQVSFFLLAENGLNGMDLLFCLFFQTLAPVTIYLYKDSTILIFKMVSIHSPFVNILVEESGAFCDSIQPWLFITKSVWINMAIIQRWISQYKSGWDLNPRPL